MSTALPIPAAQYLRMSTESQHYSIPFQEAAISAYSAKNNFTIVKTYSDAGKSGLALKHRIGLSALLQDVLSPGKLYRAVLVYDVSRWGRFQDADESARLVRPDGTACWIDARGVIVRNGCTHMIGIGLDITDLKKTEQLLREGEEKYRKLFENATYGVFLAKPDGTLLDVNPALVVMLGYGSREELLTVNLGRDIYENPAERAAIIEKARPNKRVEGVEVNWCRKDGKTIPVRMSGAAILSEDGVVSHYEVIVENITERRRLEAQYRQSQKMEAVGLLVGGISHDFNDLLGVILGNADLLLEKTSPVHTSAMRKPSRRLAAAPFSWFGNC